MEHSISQLGLTIGISLLTAVVALVLLAYLFQSNRPTKRFSGPENDKKQYIFHNGSLSGSPDEIETLFKGIAPDQSDWDRFIHRHKGRFPDIAQLPNQGNGMIRSAFDRDKGRMMYSRQENLCTIALEDRVSGVQELHDLKSARDELNRIRSVVRLSPNPSWITDKEANVIWANNAYLNLIKNHPPDDIDTAIPKLFDVPMELTLQKNGLRTEVQVSGDPAPKWFDVQSTPQEDMSIHYAVDVTAVVKADIARRNFVQTLTKTFAQLSIGLAIFDNQRQLVLFNPALIDLTELPAEFLSTRPAMLSFFDRLRDNQIMPEPKNYASWREQINELALAAASDRYLETWSLPNGSTYRVSGRPHPDGAIAFLFEDISAEISLTRRFRAELELGQSMQDALDTAICVFSPTGRLMLSNASFKTMWNIEGDESFDELTIHDMARIWHETCAPNPAWGDIRDFIGSHSQRSRWSAKVGTKAGFGLTCNVIPIKGGSTMITFDPVTHPKTVQSPPEIPRQAG